MSTIGILIHIKRTPITPIIYSTVTPINIINTAIEDKIIPIMTISFCITFQPYIFVRIISLKVYPNTSKTGGKEGKVGNVQLFEIYMEERIWKRILHSLFFP